MTLAEAKKITEDYINEMRKGLGKSSHFIPYDEKTVEAFDLINANYEIRYREKPDVKETKPISEDMLSVVLDIAELTLTKKPTKEQRIYIAKSLDDILTYNEKGILYALLRGENLSKQAEKMCVTREAVRSMKVRMRSKLRRRLDGILTNSYIDELKEVERARQGLLEEKKAYDEAVEKYRSGVLSAIKMVDEPKLPVDMSIDDFNFTTRTYHCLKRIGAKTIGDIVCHSRKDLMKVRDMGKAAIDEVERMLDSIGLTLRPDD